MSTFLFLIFFGFSPSCLSLHIYHEIQLFCCFFMKRSLEEKKVVREEARNAENLAKQSFEDKNAVMEVYIKVIDGN